MAFQIKFFGVDELTKRIEQMASPEKMADAMGKCCAIVERAAKQKAPKDTGALRRSIQSRVKTTADTVTGEVYSPLEYAPYVEYGTGLFAEQGNGRKDVPWLYEDDKGETHITSGQKPKPYMRPALKENRQKVVEKFSKEVLTK